MPDTPDLVTFTTTLEATSGGTTTGIRVPEHVLDALDHGRRPKLSVQIGDDFTYRTSVGVHDGAPFLSVSGAIRAEAGIAAGDVVEVTVVVDESPLKLDIPADLAAALDADPTARAAFDGLTDSQRKTFVLSVSGAKQEATRVRRVDGAIAALREGRKRP